MLRTHLRAATAASALVLLLAACGSSSDSASTTTSSTTTTVASMSSTSSITTAPATPEVTLAGYRGITWGMTLDQATAAVGKAVTADDPRCGNASFAGLPNDIMLWWVDGKIAMASLGRTQTVAGGRLRIGSTVAQVQGALGRDVTSEPSDDQTRTDLVYRTADAATAADEVRFMVVDGKVSTIDVGLRSYVEQQELCG
jgi:hypothetical protein